MAQQKSIKKLCTTILIHSLVFGCGAKTEDADDEEKNGGKPVSHGRTVQTAGMPDATGINLSGLGKSRDALSLTEVDDENCDAAGDLGVFGLPLGSACHTTKLIRNALYGTKPDANEDGVISCADYNSSLQDQGLIKALLCEEVVINNPDIESLKWEEDGKKHAISFVDYDANDDMTAIGTWTATGPEAGRYPANLRGWNAPSGATLKGLFGLKMTSGLAGSMELDLAESGEPILSDIRFHAQSDTSKCATEPSLDNCHWQDIRMKNREDAGLGTVPPGFHIFVMANEKQNADFVLIEGKVRYTAESAEQIFGNSADSLPVEFKSIREIYFRTVQKGTQIWGTFDMKDENGQTISSIVNGIDFPKVLRDGLAGVPYSGVCQNLGSSEFGDCRDINYQDYDTLWQGSASFESILADFQLKTDFSNPPTIEGLVTK